MTAAGSTVRVAALDCGTNSLRLLVADVDPLTGTMTDLTRRLEIVRLGQGVDATGLLDPAALERTVAVLHRYAREIAALDVPRERVRLVATSATRDARNREEFLRIVDDALGIEPVVVTGAEEAALSFAGATRELVGERARRPPPYLVVDIGGGSTEFVLGGAGGAEAAASLDVGSVRMTERYLHSDPPTAAEVAAARADVAAVLTRVPDAVPLRDAATLVGVAGTVTTVAAIALQLPEYDDERVHHAWLAREQVHEVAEELLRRSRDERRRIPSLHPGRVDVIGGGALVLQAVVDAAGVAGVLVSAHDILDGTAWSIAEA